MSQIAYSSGCKTKVIRGARVVDGNGGAVLREAAVLIEDKRISQVGRQGEVRIPPGAEVIDAGGCTLMPGLFDGHVHIAAYNTVTFSNYRVAMFEVSPQLQAFYTLFHAQLCLEMGFTTLRDMGRNNAHANFASGLCAVRDAINAGIMPGPRLFVSGRILTTASHHDLNLPRAAPRPEGYTVDGPWEVRRMSRQHLRTGVDIVKVCVSGGASADEDGTTRNITQDELDAAVDEAHAYHKPCAAHCWTPESHRMCIKAGVDTIEHMVFTDPAVIEMIREAGIPVTPTLVHRTDHAIETRRRCGSPKNVLDKMKEVQPYCFESFKRMHQAGVKIFMGTDIQYDPEIGSNAGELEVYVKLGMSPMEAILTATRNAAEAMKLDKDLGTLEAGKLADVIAVDGDPLHDIAVLQQKQNIKLVMKEGQVYVDRMSAVPRYVIHPEPGQWKIIDTQ
jgi:imidazolonepropionase-like amidohydrolase